MWYFQTLCLTFNCTLTSIQPLLDPLKTPHFREALSVTLSITAPAAGQQAPHLYLAIGALFALTLLLHINMGCSYSFVFSYSLGRSDRERKKARKRVRVHWRKGREKERRERCSNCNHLTSCHFFLMLFSLWSVSSLEQ